MTAFQLKVIGISLMVFDHIHQLFYLKGIPMWFTMLGRIVAPIFLFLSAEGYHYTKNKIKYLRNLLLGFWLMGLVDWIVPTLLPNENIVLANNIFGTLFLGVLAMYCYDSIKNSKQDKKQGFIGIGIILFVLAYSAYFFNLLSDPDNFNVTLFRILSIIFPTLVTTEGGFVLVLLALFFYIFREKRTVQIVVLLLVSVVATGFNFTGLFTTNIQWMMAFSAIFIWLYNGKEGKKMKWFFYYFYPVHIAILYIFATLMG